jgi:hypothetical protein
MYPLSTSVFYAQMSVSNLVGSWYLAEGYFEMMIVPAWLAKNHSLTWHVSLCFLSDLLASHHFFLHHRAC